MSDRKTYLDARAVGLLIACCFLWGLNQSAVKAIVGEVPPLVQAAVRSIGGVLFLLAWARWRRIALFERDGTAFGGVVAGVLFAAEFACVFLSLRHTSASRTAVFVYLAPFIVAAGMPFIAKAERLTARQFAGLAIAFAGVAFAFAEGFTRPSLGPTQWIGDALAVLGAVMWAATTLTIRATKLSLASPEKTLAYQLGVSGVLLAILAAWNGDAWPASWSTLAVGLLVFQTVVVVFVSYLVWFWLVRHYPATRLSAFTLLTPVFGLLAGVVLLSEPVTLRLLIALAGVVVGIALVNRR